MNKRQRKKKLNWMKRAIQDVIKIHRRSYPAPCEQIYNPWLTEFSRPGPGESCMTTPIPMPSLGIDPAHLIGDQTVETEYKNGHIVNQRKWFAGHALRPDPVSPIPDYLQGVEND